MGYDSNGLYNTMQDLRDIMRNQNIERGDRKLLSNDYNTDNTTITDDSADNSTTLKAVTTLTTPIKISPTIVRRQYYSHGPLVEQNDTQDYYWPMWQHSPLNIDLVNLDMSSIEQVKSSIKRSIHEVGVIFSEALFPFLTSASNTTSSNTTTQTNGNDNSAAAGLIEPFSIVMTPILKEFHHAANETLEDHQKDIVAILTSLMPWRLLFTNIYRSPNPYRGLILVLVDQAKKQFTFRINGPEVCIHCTCGDFFNPCHVRDRSKHLTTK
jgi:hypothetical protein